MKSKILNLIGSNTLQNDNKPLVKYMNKYIMQSVVPLNRVNYDGVMTNITTTEVTNYPITNTKNNYSIYKEAKLNYTSLTSAGFTANYSGITINPYALGTLSSTERAINNITILLNKDDKTYMNNLKTKTNLGFKVVFRRIALETPASTYNLYISLIGNGIEIRKGDTTLVYQSSNYYIDLENGIISIDEEILYKIFGTKTVDLYDLDYIIDIYLEASGSSASNIIPFQYSKIFIGQSIDFFADEGIEYTLKNLNSFNSAKRSGYTTIQINNTLKNLKLNFDNLYSYEITSLLYDLIKLNKNTPVIVLPYCNPTNYPDSYSEPYNSESKQWLKLNYELGGLYYIANDLEIKNSTYDVFSTKLELVEYK